MKNDGEAMTMINSPQWNVAAKSRLDCNKWIRLAWPVSPSSAGPYAYPSSTGTTSNCSRISVTKAEVLLDLTLSAPEYRSKVCSGGVMVQIVLSKDLF